MTIFEAIAIINMICNLGIVPGVFLYIVRLERVVTEIKTLLKFCKDIYPQS